MADELHEDVEVENEDQSKLAAGERDAAKALNSMTNTVAEKALDEKQAQKAISQLKSDKQADQAAAKQREKELAAVKVSKEDIEVVATEMEVDKKVAERRLREHGGDLAAALTSFMQ